MPKSVVKAVMMLLVSVLLFKSNLAEAAPSTNFVRWGYLYGNPAGSYYEVRCAPGSIAVGLYVRAGRYVDHIGLLCAPLIAPWQYGSIYRVGSAGTLGGIEYSMTCASGYALESIYGRSGSWFDRIGIRCRTLDNQYGYIGDAQGGWGGVEFWDAASPGQFVTHLTGRLGTYIQAVQVGYSTISW